MFQRSRFLKTVSNSRGLSLIEVLVAVAIVSIIGLSVFTVFAQGLKLWQRAASVIPDVDSDIVFEMITADLTNAYQSNMASFEGADTMMRFFSYSRRNYEVKNPEVRIRHPKAIQYLFVPEGKLLARSEEPLEILLSKNAKSRQIPYKVVVKGLKECRFEYYHLDDEKSEFQWKPYWNRDCLPKAVRISLNYDDERRVENFVKIVSLPASSCVN
jgi:prepilin-type N-terminal cleavage/methylation domain-containing protein